MPQILLLLFGRQVLSHSLQPRGLQYTSPPGPLPSPGIRPSSHPLNQWCCWTTSSSVALFSFCLQSFSASGSFPSYSIRKDPCPQNSGPLTPQKMLSSLGNSPFSKFSSPLCHYLHALWFLFTIIVKGEVETFAWMYFPQSFFFFKVTSPPQFWVCMFGRSVQSTWKN